jgi:hypothetical protein
MKQPCLYPHCTCVRSCVIAGGPVPDRDPSQPLYERATLRGIADRCHLAQGSGAGFHLSDDDMKAIEFCLRFTAMRL